MAWRPPGHHGMLDTSRKIRLPRAVLPARLESFAEEHELLWWLDREYGPREAPVDVEV
jgi:hypothetical protein